MEDINNKAYDDEFNKAEETIETSPDRYIPVPKVDKKSNKQQNEENDGNTEC